MQHDFCAAHPPYNPPVMRAMRAHYAGRSCAHCSRIHASDASDARVLHVDPRAGAKRPQWRARFSAKNHACLFVSEHSMKDTTSQKPLTQATIAAALGLTQQRVSQMVRRGMPTTSVDAAKQWRDENLDQYALYWRDYYRRQHGIRY